MADVFFWKKKKPADSQSSAELVATELPQRSARKGIRSLFAGKRFDSSDIDGLEELLISADFGLTAAADISNQLRIAAKKSGAQSEAELKELLAEIIADNLSAADRSLGLTSGNLPYVIMVVGVNGAGKTTTIGKLANWLTEGSFRVLLAAADTFRAAAVEQLASWAEKAAVAISKPAKPGQDPAAVAFEAIERAIAEEFDVVIVDTAGRLQNKADLMAELSKIKRVIEKRVQISEVLLVIDATTGQNGLAQARSFAEVSDVSGIVLSKLDGTAKGGIAFSIEKELGIPIKLVGVGEGISDFGFFDPEDFAKGLVA